MGKMGSLTLLFIHGFATGPAVWEKQIPELSKFCRVSTSLEEFAGLEKVVLVGWSMGGWKAIELYEQYPKKIKGMVLVSAFAKYLRSSDYPWGTSPALLKRLEKKIKYDFRDGLTFFYDLVFPDKRWHSLISKLPIPSTEDIKRWFEKLKFDDKRKCLTSIKIPTIIIHGQADQIVPWPAGKYLHEHIAGSKLYLLPGVGHAPMVAAPKEFNNYLKEFIEGVC